MIDTILTTVLNRATSVLSDSKDKMLAASKKKATENFDKLKVPSPESFKSKLQGISDPKSTESLQKANQVYNESVSLLEKAINRLEESKKELESIKNDINSIEDRFKFFESISSNLEPVIETFEIVLPVSINSALAASTGVVASGTVINKLGELKDQLKQAVKKFKDGLSFFNRSKVFIGEEMNKLIAPLDLGINGLQEAIDRLTLILEQLQALFTNFIIEQNLPELQDSNKGDTTANTPLAGTTVKQYLSDPTKLSTVVEDLIIPTRKVYYETREAGPGTELYESGIIETPIN